MSSNRNNKTLAFVDHSFHKKSHSGDFLRDIFKDEFEITDYWDERWDGGKKVLPKDINSHDFAFYFQVLNSPLEINNIATPILWAPMYDGVKFTKLYWNAIKSTHVKILSFSKKIGDWCKKIGLPALQLQYYIKPNVLPQKEGLHVFFWYRGGINFDSIRTLLGDTPIDSFIYLSNSDPRSALDTITSDDIEKYNIEVISKGFLSQDEYRSLVQKANIFIAPRKKEGIGMSFLEALSYGQVVIGYDEATLNEYITHNETGFLFDEKSIFPIDFSNIDMIRAQSIESYQKGFDKWQEDKKRIIPFLEDASDAKKQSRPQALFWAYLYTISSLFAAIRYKIKMLLTFVK